MAGIALSSEGSTSGTAISNPRKLNVSNSAAMLLESLEGLSNSQRLELLGSWQPVIVDTFDLQLNVDEWEVLLSSLKWSSILEEINLYLDDNAEHMLGNNFQHWTECLARVSSLKRLRICARVFSSSCALFFKQLALGLRRNHNSSLQELNVDGYIKPRERTLVWVAEMVRCSVKLRELRLTKLPQLEGFEVQALSNALKQSVSLCRLEIEDADRGMVEVLLRAFTGVDSNNLEELVFTGSHGDEITALPHLLEANILRVQISLDLLPGRKRNTPFYLEDSLLWGIGRAILRAVRLQRFSLMIDASMSFPVKFCQTLWEASHQSPLLCIFFTVGPLFGPVVDPLVALSLGGLRNVDIDFTVYPDGGGTILNAPTWLETLNMNKYVDSCSIGFYGDGCQRTRDDRSLILDRLCDNKSIKRLSLKPSFFFSPAEEVFKDIMKLLQNNFTLLQIDVGCEEWEQDGKAALLQEAIKRNARYAQYISVVRDAGLQLSTTKAGRILLCGSPMAGKTRLKKTMLQTAQNKRMDSWSGRLSSTIKSSLASELFRTRGIEIAVLRDDKEMTVAVWDLAGQWIFRALQDLLFPKTGQACIFLFLFNPFERFNGECVKKANLEGAFEKELKSWLRFIASNSLVMAHSPPQMMVALSHKDKMRRHERDLQWARVIVDQLRSVFKGVVDLCLGQDIQLVSCFDRREVRILTRSVFLLMSSIFDKLMGKDLVPSPGIELTSRFASKPEEVRRSPIWSSSELHQYFHTHSKSLRDLDPQSVGGRTILQALARYLQDVGTIIIIPESDLNVVDPNWMTEKFLGELISEGHEFQPKKSVNLTYRGGSGRDGFVGWHTVDEILSTLVEKYGQENIQVSKTHLQELLFKLDLCFELDTGDSDGHRRYFMPAVVGQLDEKLPARKLVWRFNSREGSKDFGFRLQCHDRERTCLTRSFFPTFQIKLRNMLVQKLQMNDANVSCCRGFMEIREDGHEIFVETDELQEDHIDIMVRSSSYKSKEKAIKFVEENIIHLLRTFCASEMGSMGVSLSLHILRTECVTKLTPRDLRGDNQVISVLGLKIKLEEDAKEQLEGLNYDERTSMDTLIDSCLQYAQCWPEVICSDPEVFIPEGCELARELLPTKVLEDIRQGLKRILQNSKRSKHRTHECEVLRLNDGVYEIHAPLEDGPLVELVFVHGILESELEEKPYLHTWSARNDREHCWLNTWLVSETDVDINLTQARVLAVSYDSSVRKGDCKGNMDNFQVAENLSCSLITLAGVGQHNCPVVLVGHCLGGLVIKEVCLQASRSVEVQSLDMRECENFLKNLKGIFFYSTPHLGWSSKLVDCRLPPGSSSSTGQKGELMKSLELFSKHTARTNSQFGRLCMKYGWKTRGVGESNKMKIHTSEDTVSTIMEIRVEEASARSGSLDGFCVIPDTDHFSICRPESAKSDSFLHLVWFIKYLILGG